ncbi:hybrid sensor histidine kinase/response regulator [Pseudoalteromonas rubra]|uniref:Hybrid sensor histidine kinase/response regulator n=2 Tax=Pseudoalteromonas rubra TaxID=43658 RepID=A0A5S3WH09_9GAMM|nr:hybrid sensor histidine kinase/response regulator [Pseudoalteromonas rubra]TMP31099.1 hybrid sensor histidine kinase/response regulator [Pseudoalteromonas rubra]
MRIKGMADILVVDDVAENLHMLQLILRQQGHTVLAAINAEVALNIIHRKPPELVITDIKMPGTSGIELCKLLKAEKHTSHIPVIFVSAHSDTDWIVEALHAGGNDYITKPFIPAEILARVDTQIKLLDAQKSAVKQQLSQVMNEMVIGVAHEINTPLGTAITAVSHCSDTIYKLVSSLKEGEVSLDEITDKLAECDTSLSLSERNLTRVAKFVSMVKQIARVECPVSPTRVSLLEFAEKVQCAWLNKPVSIEIIVHHEGAALFDGGLLASVIDTLIANSLSHGRQEGKLEVRIGLGIEDTQLIVSYLDNGLGLDGISEEDMLKPFVTTKRGNTGHVGLSASVAANLIVNALNGRYQVHDRQHGLEWQISLPVEPI